MMLLTKALRTKLEKNAEIQRNGGDTSDLKPVVKFFNPCGAGTWLITELDEDGMMFGLCDLGQGMPELGYVSLTELSEYRGMFGLGIERDRHWDADKTLSEYAAEARSTGSINA